MKISYSREVSTPKTAEEPSTSVTLAKVKIFTTAGNASNSGYANTGRDISQTTAGLPATARILEKHSMPSTASRPSIAGLYDAQAWHNFSFKVPFYKSPTLFIRMRIRRT